MGVPASPPLAGDSEPLDAGLCIRPFERADEAEVLALWQASGLLRPWNDPRKDIERKLTEQPELFLVASLPGRPVVGTAMAGYDGHRGWVYYLAVAADLRGRAIGRRLMHEVEQRLLAVGCPKVNLMVRSDNAQVLAFYDRLGYGRDASVSLGKRLIPDL
ncbi:GNAT family acetyltransferase [Curvibacter cyanobacteriorum]|uniref:GNAT family acetyltransferase n=1 Tax=Curvibacter cyanobacteriorum TaxID=3026422 RepID=UPI0039082FAF